MNLAKRTLLVVVLSSIAAIAGASSEPPLVNWSAPPTYARSASSSRIRELAASNPAPFNEIPPCRQYSSLNSTPLVQGENRSVNLRGAPCGIPSGAVAVSVNITVFNITGATGNGVFKVDTVSPPASAWINYPPTETQRGNAGVVALGSSGIVVQVAQGAGQVDFVVDTNGYFGGPTSDFTNVFLGPSAGNTTMTGFDNTGIGHNALVSNISGNINTAIGASALFFTNAGSANTAVGHTALYSNSGGSNNTAVGDQALFSFTSGIRNIGIGANAGYNHTTGDDNIYIANLGLAVESSTIRIGQLQNRAYIVGIYGVTTGLAGAQVFVDANGQLGTASSSARVKEQIRDMGETSSALLKLRPVTFRYKGQVQGSNPLHFGLIAEEVDEVLPELVLHRPTGEAETVLYNEIPAMLLNELQKQRQTIEDLKARLARLEARLTTEQR